MTSAYAESRFQSQVEKALKTVKTVLDVNKSPEVPTNVPHAYDDKYLLAEYMTKTAMAAQLIALQHLGLSLTDEKNGFPKLKEWTNSLRSVSLRFRAQETCTFVKKIERKEESKHQHETEVKVMGVKTATITEKVVTTIRDYYWKFEYDYELFAFEGTNPQDKVTIRSRKGQYEFITSSDVTPYPPSKVYPPIDVNITWILKNLDNTGISSFSIDRKKSSCHTPRRNDGVNASLTALNEIYRWHSKVVNYLKGTLLPVQRKNTYDFEKMNDGTLFVPVFPLFETSSLASEDDDEEVATSLPSTSSSTEIVSTSSSSSSSKAIQKPNLHLLGFIKEFLDEQKRTIVESMEIQEKTYPINDNEIISYHEAKFIVLLKHMASIGQHYADGVQYIEELLRKQLIDAIGKEVSPVDLTNYMIFHNRRLFKPEYEPVPFAYAVRRPHFTPEGIVGIDMKLTDGSITTPIQTVVRRVVPKKPMMFSLNPSTKITFFGDRYLHGWINHQFSGQSSLSLTLNARARSFSSFILMVGTITSASVFDPKHAIIVQNRDDLKIPLLLEALPTPKAFRDAIESMSAEQQRFCKAFRAMQLASTLFGVCVIQIKPMLEKVLNLPDDSLTKEIKLSKELLDLFLKYHIPSDMLSCPDDPPLPNTPAKINAVKNLVVRMQQMIDRAEKEEIRKKEEEEAFRRMEEERKQRELLQQQQLERHRFAEMEYSKNYEEEERSMVKRKAAPMKKMMLKKESKESAPAPRSRSRAEAPESARRSIAPPTLSLASSSAPVPSPVSIPLPSPSLPAPVSSPPPSAPTPVAQAPAEAAPPTSSSSEQKKDLVPSKNVVVEDDLEDFDVSSLPNLLDSKFMEMDTDATLRATTVTTGPTWSLNSQEAILAQPKTTSLGLDQQTSERNKAMDLINALTKSGGLSIDNASLHVFVAATHCFDKTLMNTVIRDNVNPIEKIERSVLIVATTVHEKKVEDIVQGEHIDRVKTYSPSLFLEDNETK
eukprot:TRINITY_DN302_c1_g1_i1.p1 TRINITY_DN302_c1_g1~~TRINITY_DN302_c1_g1_i1.p1  ORF type:complete len:995 (+),score=364.51 TRINITY_DN302_c1_g1_i1:284-3268(+)